MTKNNKVPTMVRLKPDFKESLEKQARENNMSLSALIENKLEKLQVLNLNIDTLNMNTITNYNYYNQEKPEIKPVFTEVKYE